MKIENNNAIDALAECMVTAVKKLMVKAEFDKTIATTVVTEQRQDGKYGVMYNGNIVHVPNYTGRELTENQSVMVTLPCNKYKEMYISAVRN